MKKIGNMFKAHGKANSENVVDEFLIDEWKYLVNVMCVFLQLI